MLGTLTRRPLPTILLIDDDMVSREVLATVLTMSGYTVHTAEGGAASLALLEAGECVPDVILMDTQMPGLSGVSLIRQLRARSSRAVLYVISGSNAPDEVTEASDGFLLKPLGPHALQTLLEQHRGTETDAEGAAETPEQPALNPETLAQMREMMPEDSVREIYAAVVTDLGKRIFALERAIAAGDHAEIHRLGHAIKGGCGMAGALQAARLGALLEASNQSDNTARLLQDLRATTGKLQRMLEQEFTA